jgi:hypothetical protein
MSSKGFGLAVVALDADPRPFLAFCRRRPDAGWLPLDLPAGFLGALAGVAVVAVCRGLAMLGTPMPAYRAALSYSHSCRRPRAANNPTCACTCPFNVLPAALLRSGGRPLRLPSGPSPGPLKGVVVVPCQPVRALVDAVGPLLAVDDEHAGGADHQVDAPYL